MAKSKDDHCRHVEQVDFCTCIRCGQVRSAAFVFDDGTFYCYSCISFMAGGDAFRIEQRVIEGSPPVTDLSYAKCIKISDLKKFLKGGDGDV